MSKALTFAPKVFTALCKLTGSAAEAETIMVLNFDLYARRFNYAKPTSCAREMVMYGEKRRPELIERFIYN